MKNSKTSAERYSRQLVLREIGAKGQEKLSKACVAVVGCGALGSNAADLLARAGVGRLLLFDRDFVELSNLQRQALYDESDVGKPKALAARARLERVNPAIRVESFVEDVSLEGAGKHFKKAGLVLDCTDNLEARKALNEYSVKSGKPWVYAAVVQTYGYVMPVVPGKTPCLECLFRKMPKACDLPACGTHGVLNSAAKLIASVQATQALKFIVEGKFDEGLFYCDAWNNKFDWFKVSMDTACKACS